MESQIHYDPSLHLNSGFVTVGDHPDQSKRMQERDKQTLLYVVFWLLYTEEGRTLMNENTPNATTPTARPLAPLPQPMRDNLKNAFQAKGIVDNAVLEALIDAHESAVNYAGAFAQGAMKNSERASWEKIYLQKVSFITWCLWEDAKNHEFSLPW